MKKYMLYILFVLSYNIDAAQNVNPSVSISTWSNNLLKDREVTFIATLTDVSSSATI